MCHLGLLLLRRDLHEIKGRLAGPRRAPPPEEAPRRRQHERAEAFQREADGPVPREDERVGEDADGGDGDGDEEDRDGLDARPAGLYVGKEEAGNPVPHLRKNDVHTVTHTHIPDKHTPTK